MANDAKEPEVKQPSLQDQRTYVSARDNDATVVQIPGTRKKYKIYWLKYGQITKLSRILVGKKKTDDKDDVTAAQEANADVLSEIVEGSKVACKAAAIFILHGHWRVKFRYWFLWRWFYYIRQYDVSQLLPILNEGKKKVPWFQFFTAIMSLTEVKGTLMNMTMTEAERTLQELRSAQGSQTANSSNGSTFPDTSSSAS